MHVLLRVLTGQGYHPQQAGVSSTDPSTVSLRDAARLTSNRQQQNPELLHQMMGHGGLLGGTGAKVAIAGVAVLVAKQLLSDGGFGGLRH